VVDEAAQPAAEPELSDHDPEDAAVDSISQEMLTTLITVKTRVQHFEPKYAIVKGLLSLAELVDYLMNQKDRHSFAILPEIFAPGPFFYGTLLRNDLALTGPCRSEDGRQSFQLRLKGALFPRSISAFLWHIRQQDPEVSLRSENNPHTDYLATFPVK
jgi:hypothetical protein